VLKANYEKEVAQLKTMMPDDEHSGSQDAAVVDTGLQLLCLLLNNFISSINSSDYNLYWLRCLTFLATAATLFRTTSGEQSLQRQQRRLLNHQQISQ